MRFYPTAGDTDLSLTVVDLCRELCVSGWNCSVRADCSPRIFPEYILNNRRCDGCSHKNTPAGGHTNYDSAGNRYSKVCSQNIVLQRVETNRYSDSSDFIN